MKKLTIENFLNEMSYDLNDLEMEHAIIKYQEVLVKYFISSQWLRSEKKNFHEVSVIVRSDKFLNMLEYLMEERTEDILTDMAYVVLCSTKYDFVDKDVKAHAASIAYRLRENEYADSNMAPELKMLITTMSGWVVKAYNMSSFAKVKCMEMIISKLPKAMVLSFEGKIPASSLNDKRIFGIIRLISDEIDAEDVIKALIKSDYTYDKDDKEYPYASRLKSFLYSMIALYDGRKFQELLKSVATSLDDFNQRQNNDVKLSFKGTYLDTKLLKQIVLSNEIKQSKPTQYKIFVKAYDSIERFKLDNPDLKYLF